MLMPQDVIEPPPPFIKNPNPPQGMHRSESMPPRNSFAEFMRRQDTSAARIRRNESDKFRKNVQNHAESERKFHLEDQAADGFRTIIKKKYGSIIAGWKLLDNEHRGRLTFNEFINALKFINFGGQARTLWRDLDKANKGYVTLADLDERIAKILAHFRSYFTKKFDGNLLKAWRYLDKENNTKVEKDLFIKRLKDAGYDTVAKAEGFSLQELFRLLTADNVARYVTLRDIDPKAERAFIKCEHKVVAVDGEKELKKGRTDWNRAVIDNNVKEHLEQRGSYSPSLKPAGVEELFQFLKQHYGSLHLAWEEVLSFEGSDRLSLSGLCMVARSLGFSGNMRKIWYELDKDAKGFLTFKDVDPRTYSAISEFRQICELQYGNLLTAWSKGFAKNGISRVEKVEFVGCCKKMGYHGDAEKLFQMLLPMNGPQTFITLKEFDPRTWHNDIRSDFRQLNRLPQLNDDGSPISAKSKSARGPLSPCHMTFQERQDATCWQKTYISSRLKAVEQKILPADQKPKCHREEIIQDDVVVTDFKTMLCRQYGNLARAWRFALDTDGNQRLSFIEFCTAVRTLGYEGNLKKLWHALDSDGTGHITLEEIDERAANTLSEYKALLNKKYGNFLKAWKKGLDIDKSGRLELEEFIKCNEKMGWTGDSKYLFLLLIPDAGRKYITMADLDPSLMLALYRGDDHMLTCAKTYQGPSMAEKLKMSFLERQSYNTSNNWKQYLGAEQREAAEVAEREKKKSEMGSMCAGSFRRMLMNRFGSIPRAWRRALDTDGNGKLSFGEFSEACRRVGYSGSVRTLWSCFDQDDSGTITLNEVEPETYQRIMEFRELIFEKFNNIQNAWKKFFDRDKNNHLDFKEFKQKCKDLGFSLSAKGMFIDLIAEKGRKYVQLADLDILLIGFPKKEAIIKWEGAPEAIEIKRNSVKIDHANVGAKTADEFKKLLCSKFGNIPRAWRECLDNDDNGRLSFGEFCVSCRNLGYNGNVKALWKTFDDDNSGFISLKELDPQAQEAMDSFKDLLRTLCGNTLKAWNECLDLDKNNRLDLEEFKARCKDIGYPGNATKLFKWLLPSRASFLSLENIDKEAHQAKARGDYEMTTAKINRRRSDCSMTFEERNANVLSEQWNKEIGKTNKAHVEALRAQARAQDFAPQDAIELASEMIRVFGSIDAGWEALDVSGDGKLSKFEFLNAITEMGVLNQEKIRQEFDKDDSGFITRVEFDEVACVAQEFRRGKSSNMMTATMERRLSKDFAGSQPCTPQAATSAVPSFGRDSRGSTKELPAVFISGPADRDCGRDSRGSTKDLPAEVSAPTCDNAAGEVVALTSEDVAGEAVAQESPGEDAVPQGELDGLSTGANAEGDNRPESPADGAAEKGTEDDAAPSGETATEGAPDASATNAEEQPADVPTETEKAPEATETSGEAGQAPETDANAIGSGGIEAADAPADNAAGAAADAPAHNAADAPADDAAEAAADVPADDVAEAAADVPADDSAEAAADVPADDSAEAAADAPAEDDLLEEDPADYTLPEEDPADYTLPEEDFEDVPSEEA